MTKVINFDSQEELFNWAAEEFIKKAGESLEKKTYFDVALSGGSTAQNYFKILSQYLYNFSELSRLRFFMSDERAVDLSSKDSNAGNALRRLIMPLGLDTSQLFSLYDPTCGLEEAASRYEKLLKNLLPEEIPEFDLIYLGIGEDGHTASIFPHSNLVKNIKSDQRLVASTTEEIAGHRRLSFMPKLINSAKNICIMAPGKNKAQIIDTIMTGPLDPIELPAQLIMRSDNNKVIVLESID